MPRARPDRHDATLLAQIYAAPDDDAPRLVYADWLQERGDPRGELIALQLERANGKARKGGRQREDALLATHRQTWEQPLKARATPVRARCGGYQVKPAVTFGRGFAEQVASWMFGKDPAWSTVRSCTAAPHEDACHSKALRKITGARDEDISALAKLRRPLAVEELVWDHGGDRDYFKPPTAVIGQFSSITALPALRRLVLGPWAVGQEPAPSWLAWVRSAPILAQLDTLGLPGRDLSGWIEALSPTTLPRFELSWINFDRCVTIACEREHGEFRTLAIVIEKSTREALDVLAAEIARLAAGSIRSARIAIRQSEWNRSASQRAAVGRAFSKAKIDATLAKGK